MLAVLRRARKVATTSRAAQPLRRRRFGRRARLGLRRHARRRRCHRAVHGARFAEEARARRRRAAELAELLAHVIARRVLHDLDDTLALGPRGDRSHDVAVTPRLDEERDSIVGGDDAGGQDAVHGCQSALQSVQRKRVVVRHAQSHGCALQAHVRRLEPLDDLERLHLGHLRSRRDVLDFVHGALNRRRRESAARADLERLVGDDARNLLEERLGLGAPLFLGDLEGALHEDDSAGGVCVAEDVFDLLHRRDDAL
mmetsp:Transcript_25845/g.89151  ORF Transcript_25845/g.89151 Transcript_25845/m.89151 type:complete len:256 (-) Transcript_25845:230-997(-)